MLDCYVRHQSLVISSKFSAALEAALYEALSRQAFCITFLLTGLRIYTGEYKAQGPTLCPTEGRALRGPRALYSPV